MTKAELIAEVAEKAGLSRPQARDALDAFVATVTASLKAGKQIRLVGLGSFVPVGRPAGISRNPKTGAKVNRAAAVTARFRIGETLKNALNRGRPGG